jgi:hypothetical protein
MLLVIAGCGNATATHWRNLKQVTVTAQNGSLPPPGGAPHTTRFITAAAVKTVTAALNRYHIASRPASQSDGGCTGGFNLTIAIVPMHGRSATLTTYLCGGSTYGGIAGNVPSFMSAIGVSTP